MRLVCISDTHNQLDKIVDRVPKGDVLIHAGDFTNLGTFSETVRFGTHLRPILKRFKHIIYIAGNHDKLFETDSNLARNVLSLLGKNVHYLQDSEIVIDGVRFYGSPWQPEFRNWAFNRRRGPELKRFWDRIPEDVDVLITHGPPYGFLDVVQDPEGVVDAAPRSVGCEDLRDAIQRTKPDLNVFGHVHQGYGMLVDLPTTYVNASICNSEYSPIRDPIVVDYDAKTGSCTIV